MAKFVLHRITGKVGASANAYDFFFLAPPDSYKGIETECGVTEIKQPDDIGHSMPLVKVEQLLRSEAAVRRKLRIRKANGTTGYKSIVVAQEKAAGFETAVAGKTSDKGVVTGVVESLDATFY